MPEQIDSGQSHQGPVTDVALAQAARTTGVCRENNAAAMARQSDLSGRQVPTAHSRQWPVPLTAVQEQAHRHGRAGARPLPASALPDGHLPVPVEGLAGSTSPAGPPALSRPAASRRPGTSRPSRDHPGVPPGAPGRLPPGDRRATPATPRASQDTLPAAVAALVATVGPRCSQDLYVHRSALAGRRGIVTAESAGKDRPGLASLPSRPNSARYHQPSPPGPGQLLAPTHW